MKLNIKLFISFNVILISSATLGEFSLPQIAYYASFFLLLVFILNFNRAKIKFNLLFVFYWFFAFISILLNDIPPVFKSDIRFILFTMMLLTFSPLLFNERISRIRLFIFNVFINSFFVICFISFFAFILGFKQVTVVDAIRGYQGITNHPNTLAPLAGYSLLYVLVKFSKFQKIYFYTLLAMMIFLTLVCGSRAVILGVIVSSLVFLFLKKYLNFKGVLISTFVIGICYLLVVNSYIEINILSKKNEFAKNEGSITSSRDILWNARLREFYSSPIFGIGFNSVDLYHYNKEMSNNEKVEEGTVETGSAWLGQFSMIGLLGALTFILIFFKSLKLSVKNIQINNDYLLAHLLLIFFVVHLIFEGNVFAAGSPMILFLWITISVCNIKPKKIVQ